jgi:hypothetical protein
VVRALDVASVADGLAVAAPTPRPPRRSAPYTVSEIASCVTCAAAEPALVASNTRAETAACTPWTVLVNALSAYSAARSPSALSSLSAIPVGE